MTDIFSDEMRKKIASYITDNSDRIEVNRELFTILEGNMTGQLTKKMLQDLGQKSFKAASPRQAPINYYKKVIDKLTTIYQQGVVRKVVNGTDSDQELVDWYSQELNINSRFNANNESFNAYQYSLLHMTLKDPDPRTQIRKPFIRTIPNHEYLVMNASRVDPTDPTIIIVFQDPIVYGNGEKKNIFYVYTDTQFMIMDSKGNVEHDLMNQMDQDGNNYFLSYPFVYANNSENLVMPEIQNDDLQMAILPSLLLTDLNYAHKFQAFSLFVAIDVDDAELDIAPNAWLSLKSDPQGIKPSVDTIKPSVDTASSLSLNSSEISLWLSSKGIRPGSIGTLEADQFSSGVSKMIDESDTFESRKKQIEEYKVFERTFWEKLLKVFHPIWVADNLIDNRTIFSPNAEVVTIFPTPKPMQTRADLVNELNIEVQSGFKSREDAMKELYPDLSDDEILDKMASIDAERIYTQIYDETESVEEEVEE